MTLPEIKLSDGRIARFIRKPKVGDISKALRMVGPKGNEIDKIVAVLSLIVEFDGSRLVMEDLQQLDLPDYLKLKKYADGDWQGNSDSEGECETENFSQWSQGDSF